MNEKQKKNLKTWGVVSAFIGVLMMFGGSSASGFVITFFGVILFIAGYAKTNEPIKVPEQSAEKKPMPVDKEQNMKILLGFLAVIMVIITFSSLGDDTPSTPQPTQATVSPEAKEDARKELNELMQLSAKADLVRSYEFSDKANVVFVDSAWYVQDVAFKKDFMAKIAMLKKTITGYQHYELHDAYSDEKVAEVTAFSGALEVYK